MELERLAREKRYDDEWLMEMRENQVKPIIKEFYEPVNSLSPGKGSHLYEAVTYAQNQKKELPVFLEHPEVEMTNNLAERLHWEKILPRSRLFCCCPGVILCPIIANLLSLKLRIGVDWSYLEL